MTLTKIWNHFVYLVCMIGVVLSVPNLLNIIPAKYQIYLAVLSGATAWIKGNRNLGINPDGTPATTAYQPPAQ